MTPEAKNQKRPLGEKQNLCATHLPPTTGRARSWSVLLEDGPRNDQTLHLACTLVDLGNACVTVVALHREVRHVPVTAVDLDCLVCAVCGGLRRKELRHSCLLAVLLPAVLELSSTPREEAGGLDLGCHVSELELDRLQARDRRAERLPLVRVRCGGVEGGLRDAERLRCDPDAAPVQRLHRDLESLPLLAEEGVLGDLAAFEHQAACSRGPNCPCPSSQTPPHRPPPARS
mmetsp:Transcript_36712/g.74093  ORF Transcript_36712/g.74093 Transcript_36712/m.74093 type:complete len:231 (-) Transcript_36712:486-1178(-)